MARPRNNKYDCYIFTIPKNNIIGQISDRKAYGCFKKNTSNTPTSSLPIQEDESQRNRPRPSKKK